MAKEVEKNKKEKKHFLKDFKAELKKVIWPTPKQVVNNTIAVITIVIITAVIVLVLDLAFEALNTYGIDHIRGLVTKTNTVNETNVVDNNTTTANEISINETTGEGNIEINMEQNNEAQVNNTQQD